MLLRDRESLLGNLFIPAGLLVVLAVASGSTQTTPAGAATWLLAGVIVQSVMNSGLGSDMAWLTQTRDQGILLHLRTTPLPAIVLVLAYASARLLLVATQVAVIIGLAAVVLGVAVPAGSLPAVLAVTLLGGAVFLLFGQAVAAVAPTASAASVFATLLFFVLLFLSQLIIPNLPDALAPLVRWSPAFMLVDLLRPLLMGTTANQAAWINLLGLGAYAGLALLLIGLGFRWEPRR
jgi:ABC-2 type transport system permease protein